MQKINLLERLRSERGLTIGELAAMSKVNTATISQLENGHRKATLRTLGKLAMALEVKLDDLLVFWDDDSERKRQAALKREAAKKAGAVLAQVA